MPPKGVPQPSDADRLMFGEWLVKLKYLSQKDPGPFVIRRLTKTEYGNTLHDLFGVEPSIADGLPDEVSGEGYLNSLSALQLEQYLTIADKVLGRIVAPKGSPATQIEKRLFGKSPAAGRPPRGGARGRPVSCQESLPAATDAGGVGCAGRGLRPGKAQQTAYQQSLQLMLKAILVSPQFLFITPAGEVRAEQRDRSARRLSTRFAFVLSVMGHHA